MFERHNIFNSIRATYFFSDKISRELKSSYRWKVEGVTGCVEGEKRRE